MSQQEANLADKILVDPADKMVSGGFNYPEIFGGLDIHAMNKSLMVEEEMEKEQGEEAQATNQKESLGLMNQTIPHPVDIVSARKMKDISPHHASCIQSKKYSTLGLGFVSKSEEVNASKDKPGEGVKDTENKIQSLLTGEAFIESKVDEMLNPLTIHGFMFELYRTIEDFLDGGSGYLEIVRDGSEAIVGINWLPYEDIHAVSVRDKDNKTRLVYKYRGSSFSAGTNMWYSLFGKANRKWVYDNYYKSNAEKDLLNMNDGSDAKTIEITSVSEIIPFMVPSNRTKYYGYPEWLSASSIITLLSMAMQYKSDFYTNKGVLAYILSIAGTVGSDKWKEIETLVQGGVGDGNRFKNLAIQVGDSKAKVKVDKLASDEKAEVQYSSDQEVFAQNIVSAHRVPPVLANILIPGKLGATNEAVQALVSFQLLVIGPYQTMIQKVLARTLGGDEGIKGLDAEDFRLRTITSQFDITGLDTIGRAREEATGSGRDFSEGVRD